MTPHLTYQILTKRPDLIKDRLPDNWYSYGYKNVWLGVSIESQDQMPRLDILQSIPAYRRWVSAEPLLGPLDFWERFDAFDVADNQLAWIVTGGESGLGQNYRPANLDWFRQIRDDCLAYDIPFFHKQHGGNKKINGVWGGRELDGRTWDEMPI